MKRLLDNDGTDGQGICAPYLSADYIPHLGAGDCFPHVADRQAMGKIVVVPHPGDYVNVRYSCIWISSKKMLT